MIRAGTPTSISLMRFCGECDSASDLEIIGYCVESPDEVLSRTCQSYAIARYFGINTPDYRASRQEGLWIREGNPPAGTTITGSLDDLELRPFEIYPDSPRTLDLHREVLRKATYSAFRPRRKDTNYLFDIDKEGFPRDEDKEATIERLLEMAGATLSVVDPTPDVLKAVLTGDFIPLTMRSYVRTNPKEMIGRTFYNPDKFREEDLAYRVTCVTLSGSKVVINTVDSDLMDSERVEPGVYDLDDSFEMLDFVEADVRQTSLML